MKNLFIKNKKLLISVCILSLSIPHSFSFAMMSPEEEEFIDQQRKFLHSIVNKKKILIDNDKWAVSILVQPNDDSTGMTGHGILAFVGKHDDEPLFWAADFNGNFSISNPMSVIGAMVFVCNDATIRTMDCDRENLMNALRGFSTWRYSAWGVSKEKAQEIQNHIAEEKGAPPSFNLFGRTFALWNSVPVHNCSSWAAEKVRQCGIDISGTLLYQILGISATGLEQYWQHQ